jgi:amino acid transporter
VLFFAALFTALNLNGVETSARINEMMAAALGVVILVVVIAIVRYLLNMPPQPASFYTNPFYDSSMFSSRALFRGTSIAVLTYIGFDGISTLTDEAKDPDRTVPRAIVATCLITGILASIEVYLGQLVWPHGLRFPDIDTAYVYIAGRAGGPLVFAVVNGALLLATVGSGMASQMGAARLLLAMGQDGAIPRRFFGEVHPKNRIPRNNVLLIGAICLVGALLMSYQLGTELLNYGALLAFMGVNVSSVVLGWRRGWSKEWFAMAVSAAGFAESRVLLVRPGRWSGLRSGCSSVEEERCQARDIDGRSCTQQTRGRHRRRGEHRCASLWPSRDAAAGAGAAGDANEPQSRRILGDHRAQSGRAGHARQPALSGGGRCICTTLPR